MNVEILNIIKNQFPSLYEQGLKEAIATEGKIINIPAGDVILNIGSNIKSIPLLVKGSIKVLKEDDDANELLMYYVNSGETCAMSLTCCLQSQTSKIRAIAEEDSTIISIPIKFTDTWMQEYTSWKNFIMMSYQIRFDELLNTIDSLAFKNMDERLLKYLKNKAKNSSNKNISTTHQDIAYDLNSSSEVISRLLKKIESKGLIKLGRNKVELL